MKVLSALNGALIGLLIGFSFVFLGDMTGDMFAGRPYGLSWITGGYRMLALGVVGALLGGWRRTA